MQWLGGSDFRFRVARQHMYELVPIWCESSAGVDRAPGGNELWIAKEGQSRRRASFRRRLGKRYSVGMRFAAAANIGRRATLCVAQQLHYAVTRCFVVRCSWPTRQRF